MSFPTDPNGRYWACLFKTEPDGIGQALIPETGFENYTRYLEVIAKVPVRLSPDELKACPFCGGEPEVVMNDEVPGDRWIACKGCGASSASSSVPVVAVENWNRRGVTVPC